MIRLDDALAGEFLAAARERLASMETDLLAIEKDGAEIDEERVNRVFRAIHSIKGESGFFDLPKISKLAHKTEDVLGLIRSREIVPTRDRMQVLFRAMDQLDELIRNAANSNDYDIRELLGELEEMHVRAADRPPEEGPLRMLLVEDDFASRLLLQTFLSRYGECHIAVNGREAVEACQAALERGRCYDLICMDIMMPEMDGREAVRRVRASEEEHHISSTHGSKIIMTTAVDDIKEVSRCFQELCDDYLVKPIDLAELLAKMKQYQLVA